MGFVDRFTPKFLLKDILSGLIVFLVALPLCLGIALASDAPLFSGLISGIIGGILVGMLSGSHTSVSGPAAGLTAIVAAQIAALGSFEAFLTALVIAGVIQFVLGVIKAGALSAFFPSSVINGLLAAIGAILILKQIPHLFGHDVVSAGELAFQQPDHHNTFTELFTLLQGEINRGAMAVGLISVAILIIWDRVKFLKNSLVPAPLVVVLLGVFIAFCFDRLGGVWYIGPSHLVQVPVADSLAGFVAFLRFPDLNQLAKPACYVAAVTLAIVASLESLLNLEAVDKLDPQKRHSPPNRELLAQGAGNVVAGLVGGLPMTCVVIRGSVNVNAGARTKLSAIAHGILLLVCVALMPTYLNRIPLASLAAILILTGFKLANPVLFRRMWNGGRYQFLPFIITLSAIVLTDLLVGILIGLGVSLIFILYSSLRQPMRRTMERHVGDEVMHIELPNQVSFLNRASLESALRDAAPGSHVLLDARATNYIDPDLLAMITDFKQSTGPARNVRISLRGFRDTYQLEDDIQFVDFTTRELQSQLTPERVLEILREGNNRFRLGKPLRRDLQRQLRQEIISQHPMAVVLSGINSRSPIELIFDLGLGDVFSIRIGGNVVGPKVLGCMEYGCEVAGAKLILVMGHSGSAFIQYAIEHLCSPKNGEELTGCQHLDSILLDIQESMDVAECEKMLAASQDEQDAFIDEVARRNVLRAVRQIPEQSDTIRQLVAEGKVAIVGAMYDVASGDIDFFTDSAIGELSYQKASR